MDIFTEINAQGTAVMLVTHDARIAARTERVLFLCDGRIVREAHFPQIYRERYGAADGKDHGTYERSRDITGLASYAY